MTIPTNEAKPTRESVTAWAARQLGKADANPTPASEKPWQEDEQTTAPPKRKHRAKPKPRPAITKLLHEHRACLNCGHGVDVSGDESPGLVRLTSYGREVRPDAPELERLVSDKAQPETSIEFVRCADCTDLADLAERIVAAHPAVGGAIGSRSIAVERVETALAALAALGHAQQAPRLTKTDRDLLRLLRLLTRPGADARWAARLVPVTRWNADSATCSAEPWTHLEHDQTTADKLRQAYGQLLRERTERPTPVPCPTGGCVLCGVRSVLALPSRASSAWQGVTYRRQEAHACAACSRAITYAGTVGPTATDRAVFEHLGVPLHERSGVTLTVTAWADMHRQRGSERPWQHLGNLSALSLELGVTA